MRALGLGIGAAIAFGVAAVTAATLESGMTAQKAVASISLKGDPACAPGPDFSAAVCRAAEADPNIPIITAPYGGNPAPLAAEQASLEPASRIPPREQSTPSQPPMSLASLAAPRPRSIDIPPLMTSPPIYAPAAALTMRRTWTERAGAHLLPLVAAARSLTLANNLRQRLESLKYAGKSARMFVFAGDGAQVLAYNFTRSEDGVKIAGWSMENTVRLGEQQVGMAWQSGRIRVAVAGVQRKFERFGVSLKDKVAAISITLNTGDMNGGRGDQTQRW